MNNNKKAFIIGHHEKSKGAYSDTLETSEWDFYKSMEEDLKEIGDVFTHNSDILSYTQRCIETGKRVGDDYDMVICLHFNSVSNEEANGVECLYYGSNKKGKYLSKLFNSNMSRDMGYKNRGIKPILRDNQRGFGELYYVKPTAILIEPFFGSNKEDCERFDKTKFLEILKCLK